MQFHPREPLMDVAKYKLNLERGNIVRNDLRHHKWDSSDLVSKQGIMQ